jgi:hypothetical protein
MVIFEDLEYKKKNVFDSEAARQVMLNGRHDKTYPMCLVQYIMKGLTLEVRSMFDYAFFTKEPNIVVRKKIWQVFGGVCTSFEEFDAIFRMCTDDHRMLVIKLRENSYDIADTFFYFKAKDMGEFRIGHPDFWISAEELKQNAKKKSHSRPVVSVDDDDEISQQPTKKRRTTKKDKKMIPIFDGPAATSYKSKNDSDDEDDGRAVFKPNDSAYCVKSGKIFQIAPPKDM